MHAYLIIAHNKFNQLKKLLQVLDDPRNDLFIHIDKKSLHNFCLDDVKQILKYSKIYLIENPVSVIWGSESQIVAELLLLKKATNTNQYDYYHLLSGIDFPLKSQEYIHNFFDNNKGKEFIEYCFNNNIEKRIQYYYFFNKFIGKPNTIPKKIVNIIEKISIKIQEVLNLKRYPNKIFYKGANWFSITDKCARYIINKKEEILQTYKNSFCCDELFVQTIIYGTQFYDNLYFTNHNSKEYSNLSIMRYIDWKRGNPYTFKSIDYDNLINSPYLWGRKFDEDIDSKIIDKLIAYITHELPSTKPR